MAGSNDQISLEELMRRAQKGDQRAYAMLFAEITPILRAFIGRRLGGHADTEDVVQNILLSIHRAGQTYDTARPFKVWMFAIARHRLNDHLREAYKKGETVGLEVIENQNLGGNVTNDAETREYLRMMLDSLPERQRRIITMMKVEGQSVNDVAKKMNMSPSAVKVAAHRAYKALALKAEGLEK